MLGGETYINPNLGARMAAEPDAPDGPPDDLTPREIEVLGLLALGYMNPEIADKLVLSVRTVETHRANIQRKTGLVHAGRADRLRDREQPRRALSNSRARPPRPTARARVRLEVGTRRSSLLRHLGVVGERVTVPLVRPGDLDLERRRRQVQVAWAERGRAKPERYLPATFCGGHQR